MLRWPAVGTTPHLLAEDAPGDGRAGDDELDLVRTTAAQVFGDPAAELAELGAMGWLGLLSPADAGGSGWLPVEAAAVAGEAGRNRDGAGWAAATVGAAAVSSSGAGLAERWAPGALDGSGPVRWLALEVAELEGPGSTPRLSAVATHVVAAERSAAFVGVTPGGSLVLVDATDAGVSLVGEPTALDTRDGVGQVRLASVPATPLVLDPAAVDGLRAAALVLGAASASGALAGAVDRLAAYLSERIAFGAPIASFQAVQHRIVDLYVLQRRIEAVLDRAARRLARSSPDALRWACVAHAYVAERIVPAFDECIQLSGGIGFVWEYPLHHEMRAALTDVHQFGTARSSRARLAEIEGW